MIQDKSAPKSPARRAFAVPRRFDLATLLVITLAYAVLFGILRGLEVSLEAYLFWVGLITWVAVAQAIGGPERSPRGVSLLAGPIYFYVYFGGILIYDGLVRGIPVPADEWAVLFVAGIFYGFIFGYAMGVVAAGVFLVAHQVRVRLPHEPESDIGR